MKGGISERKWDTGNLIHKAWMESRKPLREVTFEVRLMNKKEWAKQVIVKSYSRQKKRLCKISKVGKYGAYSKKIRR